MTTTLPALRDAMTAADIVAHERNLTRLVAPNGHASIVAMPWGEKPAYVSISPHGVCESEGKQTFEAATWPDAINAAYAWLANRPMVARAERVRKMALAIIDIKDQDGSVKEWRLRARDFTAAEIADLGAEACARAGELCLGAPFEIVT